MMRKQYGLSLVELMISITLGLVLMTGVVQMFMSSKVVFTSQQGMSRIQETGRLATEFLARDIRSAGYYGCFRPNVDVKELDNKSLVISGLHGRFDESIRGYDAPSALPGGVSDLGAGLKLLPESKNTQNIVVIRSTASGETGFIVSEPHTSTNVNAYTSLTALDNGCAAGICAPSGSRPGSVAVINDCTKARVFQVSGLTLGTNKITVTHADAWDMAPVNRYETGEVLILPMNTTVYFLAERPGSTSTNGVPSLWQKTNTDTAIELLEGVEHMRVTYATSDNTSYRLSSAISAADWPKVTSVRLELVVRSIENNVVDEKQIYKFAGNDVTPPDGDLYLRQVFNVTVGIRNRATNIQ